LNFKVYVFYVIVALKRNFEFSIKAGLKYFILGAFSSRILLFGYSMIYGFIGFTNFDELVKIFTGYKIILFDVQSSGLFMGILFKIIRIPFHMWALDVYEGSLILVTTIFSIAPKISILANMVRVFIDSFNNPTWQQVFFL